MKYVSDIFWTLLTLAALIVALLILFSLASCTIQKESVLRHTDCLIITANGDTLECGVTTDIEDRSGDVGTLEVIQ